MPPPPRRRSPDGFFQRRSRVSRALIVGVWLLAAAEAAAQEPVPAPATESLPAPATEPVPPPQALIRPAGSAPPAEGVLVDRVVVRFTAPETGGVNNPRFIFERELAFEARIDALGDTSFTPSPELPYLDRHVRGALERHMAETLLESLEITPEPGAAELEQRVRSARLGLREQLGGEDALARASQAEGIDGAEIQRLLARRARASLYLDRMVATMLTPSDTELRIVHRTTRTPFSGQPYEAVAPLLQRWYVGQRLSAAVRAFYEGARSRIKLTFTTAPAARP